MLQYSEVQQYSMNVTTSFCRNGSNLPTATVITFCQAVAKSTRFAGTVLNSSPRVVTKDVKAPNTTHLGARRKMLQMCLHRQRMYAQSACPHALPFCHPQPSSRALHHRSISLDQFSVALGLMDARAIRRPSGIATFALPARSTDK